MPSLYSANAAYFRDLLASHTSIETPDSAISMPHSPGPSLPSISSASKLPATMGDAFTAGFVSSGDSVRPGFGWFFGRDALWTLYAVDSYGDFPAARQEFDFLIRHQRADGKIMHEYSQTADARRLAVFALRVRRRRCHAALAHGHRTTT